MKSKSILFKASAFSILFLIPILLLILMELFFTTIYYFSSSKYFETYIQSLARRPRDNLEYNSFLAEELKGNKLKIAVFGGSSSAGYAVPYSFSHLINETVPDEVVVHKYAENGAPFVGFQAEILKKVSKFYDVIIVYAGHNEIIGHLLKTAYNNEVTLWPDGSKVLSKSVMLTHNKKMDLLDEIFYPKQIGDKGYFKSKVKSFFNKIYFYSRVSNFARRALYNIEMKVNKVQIKKIKEYPLIIDKPYIDLKTQLKFKDNFASTSYEIIKSLRSDQKIIFSTVLTNDLYTPNLDYVKKNHQDTFNLNLQNTIKSYKMLEENRFDDLEIMLNKLETSAHKSYLISAKCLNDNFSKYCLEIAKKARLLDSFPVRVTPAINSFISTLKQFDSKNVYVVDPIIKLLKSKDRNEYLSYFVDHSHPSSKGQAMIANEFLKVLFPKNKISISRKDNVCDNFLISVDGKDKVIKPSSEEVSYAYVENSGWLKNNIEKYKLDFIQQYYLKKANSKYNLCK